MCRRLVTVGAGRAGFAGRPSPVGKGCSSGTSALASKGCQLSRRLDIVLPCLDEAAALPWVLAADPGRRARDRGRQRFGRRVGAARPGSAARGGRVRAARLRRGLPRRPARRHAPSSSPFCDCDASIDPAAALDFVALLRDGAPIWSSAAGCRWVAAPCRCTARVANLELARRVRRRTGPGAARRRAAAGRPPGRPAGAGRLRPPVRLPGRDGAAGRRGRLARRRADVDYTPRAGRSKVTGTVRGTLQAVRDMSAVLAT